jgi:hypothetical protein
MNIVVCVKYVSDATADRHFESDNTVDRVGVPGLLSELDEYAVEQGAADQGEGHSGGGGRGHRGDCADGRPRRGLGCHQEGAADGC